MQPGLVLLGHEREKGKEKKLSTLKQYQENTVLCSEHKTEEQESWDSDGLCSEHKPFSLPPIDINSFPFFLSCSSKIKPISAFCTEVKCRLCKVIMSAKPFR